MLLIRMKMRNDLKDALQGQYLAFTERRVDSKTLSYWHTNIDKGAKTLDEFQAFVARSSDYSNALVRRFTLQHVVLLGTEPDPAEVGRFLQGRQDGELLDESSIRAYVTRLPEFVKQYRDLIVRVHDSVGDNAVPLSEGEVQRLLNKFVTDPSYDTDALETDLSKAPAPPVPPPPPPTPPPPAVEAAPQPNGMSVAADVVTVVPGWVDSWERVFNRAVFLQEYLKFGGILSEKMASSPEAAVRWIESYKAHMDDQMLHANDLLMRYAGRQSVTTEHAFVKTYLDVAQGAGFLDELLEELLKSDEYRKAITDSLAAAYKNTYDETLDADAKSYLFAKALALRLSLVDPRLQELLVGFHEETLQYNNRIFDTYLTMYDREPDAAEVNDHLCKYRAAGPAADTVDTAIAHELINSIEFHDTLKKRVRAVHLSEFGSDIATSRLYKTLQECVSKLHGVDSMDGVDMVVKRCLLTAAAQNGFGTF